MKDNEFNTFFCKNWHTLRPFLVTWRGVAQKFLIKKALTFIIETGDKRKAECPH